MHRDGFNKFYWGILFIMINFRIQGFDILPNIVGYALFASGFSLLATSSLNFGKASKFNIPMIFLSLFSIYERPVHGGIQYPIWNPIGILHTIIVVTLNLLVMYHLFLGIKDMAEQSNQMDIYQEADKRWSQFLILQIAAAFAFVMIFIPPIAVIYFIGILIAYIAIAIIIMGFLKKCGENL